MEIERKWLVDKTKMPNLEKPGYQYPGAEKLRIEQYYLNSVKDEWLIRLRRSNDIYWMELKTQGLLSREELRFEISQREFFEAIKLAKTSIRKTRYCFKYINHLFEFDVYDDHDFVTCEVEFDTEDEAHAFVAPDFCVEDVTNDPKYKNVNLAK